ncbi:hypothetical protein SLNSH_17250 [Alsobacter soli]|uniref:DUF4124 domain-containing protein n=1 Tax=Alsobacter soli TaxID=2109933 RepID=A0A2T1HPW2_9HYPH|nr:hypothetical protein [Alsobacter soli]PSC03694.1 hypothetical protein SLNSH_17250 [Alsobacter soli]
MSARTGWATLAALLLATPASALDEPMVWRDDTGCAYLLTPQGGIAPRLRRDGAPDCPDSAARLSLGSPIISDQAMRDMQRGLEALRRDLDKLGDRLRR